MPEAWQPTYFFLEVGLQLEQSQICQTVSSSVSHKRTDTRDDCVTNLPHEEVLFDNTGSKNTQSIRHCWETN